MPLVYTNTMTSPTANHPFRQTFKWVNDPGEDAAFLDFARAALVMSWGSEVDQVYRNLIVDRADTPTVKWDLWEQTGPNSEWEFQAAKQVAVGTGTSYWGRTTSVSKRNLGIGALDMDIYWECDARGRALTIDSVVAP